MSFALDYESVCTLSQLDCAYTVVLQCMYLDTSLCGRAMIIIKFSLWIPVLRSCVYLKSRICLGHRLRAILSDLLSSWQHASDMC